MNGNEVFVGFLGVYLLAVFTIGFWAFARLIWNLGSYIEVKITETVGELHAE